MSKIQTIAAIDIGTTKVVAIVGTRDEMGKVKVLGFGEAPSNGVFRGSVQNVGEVSLAIKQAVKRCQEFSGVVFKNVFVGIAGQNIKIVEGAQHTKVITNQIISQADIDELTQTVYALNKDNGEEIIHVIPQSYSVDNHPVGLNAVGCSGKKLEGNFYVVVGRAHAVQKIRQAIEMSGLSVIKIVLQSIASADAVLTKDDKEVGTLVADIGAGTTDVAIYQDNVLRCLSVIPFGGNSITNDIKTACQLLSRQAENLKLKYASALQEPNSAKTIITIPGRSEKEISLADLATITGARAEEIVAGIASVLNESHYADKVSQIALTGGGSKLKNLTTLSKYCLCKDVEIMRPRDFAADNCPILFNVEYSTAVGLLVKGIEYMESFYARRKATPEANDKPGDDKKPDDKKPDDTKPKPDTEKKSNGLFTKVVNLVNKLFAEDATTSKL